MPTECSASELRFSLNGVEFAAQEWGNAGNFPVLALHGWLDNSASFSKLAPLLTHLHIIALDMAGHGRSGHRPGFSSYALWEDVIDIFAVADYFGWNEFALLGHSRGAIVSMLAAGTFPERIRGLALIEGVVPEPTDNSDAPNCLARAIRGVDLQLRKPHSVYPDIQTAINAREHGLFPLSHAAASLLTDRGLKAVEGGYYWSTDPRLLAPSAIKFSPEQIQTFMDRITAPIKLLLAVDGLPKIYSSYVEELAQYSQIKYEVLDGGHHLHLEVQALQVAQRLNHFFGHFI